jgi:serine acetyltransferase
MRLNAFTTHATIRRKADIAPGFVILHSLGVVINTNVRAGRNLVVYHNVTLGESVDSTAFNPVMRTFLQDYRRNKKVREMLA